MDKHGGAAPLFAVKGDAVGMAEMQHDPAVDIDQSDAGPEIGLCLIEREDLIRSDPVVRNCDHDILLVALDTDVQLPVALLGFQAVHHGVFQRAAEA